jgi:hypothetical protein
VSAGLQAWVAETGAELPFRQAGERPERLTGIGLGAETVRAHTEGVGTASPSSSGASAKLVGRAQEAAELVDAAPELLVVGADGVLVHFQDDRHEAKVGEGAGCRVGNGRPADDPAARAPQLLAPSYVPAHQRSGQCARLRRAPSQH